MAAQMAEMRSLLVSSLGDMKMEIQNLKSDVCQKEKVAHTMKLLTVRQFIERLIERSSNIHDTELVVLHQLHVLFIV